MKKIKICFVGLENLPVLAPEFNHHGIGGEQVQHTLLAKSLARRGYDTSMVVYDYGQPDIATWDRVTTYKAYRQHAGIPVLRFLYPRLTGVWSALQRADADVYYVSCAGMQLGLIAMFCQLHDRRVVFRVAHDADCDPQALLVSYWRDRKLYEYGLRQADAILVQSQQQQRALQHNYRLDSELADMLVDFPDTACDHEGRLVDVLWVNNIREFKRPDLLLDLARLLPQRRLQMIGGAQPGEQALYDDIRRQAQALPNVMFEGRIPCHDMGSRYAGALVFVNTSDSEGFPNSFLQAWARGTPVVSFFDPDNVIEREGLGMTVTSLEAMASAVETLASDPLRWHETSERCVAYMQARYREERVLAPYLKLLQPATGRPVCRRCDPGAPNKPLRNNVDCGAR